MCFLQHVYYLMFDLTFTFFLFNKKLISIILPNYISLNLRQMKELYQVILHLLPDVTLTLHYLLIIFAANSKKSATFLKLSNCWQCILAKVRETYCVYLPLSYLPKTPLCKLSAIRCIVVLSSLFLPQNYSMFKLIINILHFFTTKNTKS